MSDDQSQRRILVGIELGLALLLTAGLVGLYVVSTFNAGGLWRDEVLSVNLASMPTLGTMLAHNHYDSFPSLFSIVLRGWMGIGMGDSDLELRLLCSILGVALVGTVWWTTRQLGSRIPLIALTLFCLCPTTFRFSNGVRAYTLGVVTMLLTTVAIWNLVRNPTARNTLVAGVMALLSVHAQFNNCAMLLAICCGGCAYALYKKGPKTVVPVLLIGVVSAASMLPYLRTFASHSKWKHLMQMEVGSPWFMQRFAEAVSYTLPGDYMYPVWLGLFSVAVGGGCHLLNRFDSTLSAADKGRAVFLLATMGAALLAFFGYLSFLSVHTTVWYYLPLMAILAVALDALIDFQVRNNAIARIVRAAGVVAIVSVSSGAYWQAAHTRLSNLDVVTEKLGELTEEGDYIVVNPWYTGVTFHRYYDGPAEWTTIPDLGEYLYQHYKPIIAKMNEQDAIRPILDKMEATLRSGRTVWVVGKLARMQPGEPAGKLRPSVDGGKTGANDRVYMYHWLRQITHLVLNHSRILEEIDVPLEGPITDYESAAIYRVQYWR